MDPRAPHRAATEALARFDRRRLKPLGVTPEFYDLPYDSLRLHTDDDVELAAWYVPAPAAAPASALGAVMHHHYGGQKAALLPWIELLHRLGVGCLGFDARGHAGSPCAPGKETYRQRFADVRAAHAELRRRGHGQSQGAAVLVGALGRERDVAGLILDSGPAALAVPPIWGMARSLVPEASATPTLTAGVITVELVRRLRPSDYAFHLWPGLLALRDRPLLWLHGSADRVIPRRWAALWFRLLQPHAPRWQTLTVAGAEHVQCLQQGGAEVEPCVARFVAQLRSG